MTKRLVRFFNIVCMAAIVVAVLGTSPAYSAPVGYTVDKCIVFNPNIEISVPSTTVCNAMSSDTSILGGERDSCLTQTTGGSGRKTSLRQYADTETLSLSSESGAAGYFDIIWDGADNDATTISHSYLSLNWSTYTGVLVHITYADLEYRLKLTLYSTASSRSEYTITPSPNDYFDPTAKPGRSHYIPFAGGSGWTKTDFGGGVSLSNVTAIVLRAEDPSDSLDLELHYIEVVPGNYIDLGDLPSGYNIIVLANNGGRNTSGDLYLGSDWDAEADGQPSANANLDGSDEDGVFQEHDWTDGTAEIMVVVNRDAPYPAGNGRGCLSGWVDAKDSSGNYAGPDGDFTDTGETIFNGLAVNVGVNALSFSLPGYTGSGNIYARFRLTFDYQNNGTCSLFERPQLTGQLFNGETEDYLWTQGPTAVTLSDFSASPSFAPAGIRLSWNTTTETNLIGFNIYRVAGLGGQQIKLNPALIQPKGLGGSSGASYEYVDANAWYGVLYTYWLEALNLDGQQMLGQLMFSNFSIFLPSLRR